MKRYTTLILGAGPGGTGLLVCAAQRGRLEAMLDGGLAVVERGARMGAGRLGCYALDSDSLATSFVECLEPRPARKLFEGLADLPVTRELIRRRREHVPLSDVAEFLGHIGSRLRDELDRHAACDFFSDTVARSVQLRDDGSMEVVLERSGGTSWSIQARSVVLAFGGRQDIADALGQSVAGIRLRSIADRVLLTDPLVSTGGGERLVEHVRQGARRIVIVGGSHSAFSVAGLLTRLPPGTGDDLRIVMLHRKRLRIFYATPEEAREDHYEDFSDEDICPRTGRVHRLGGLRGDGRLLWKRATGRSGPADPRLYIERLPEPDEDQTGVRPLLLEADLVIPAFGYRPRTLPVYDTAERRLRLAADDGLPLVGYDGRVVRSDGTPLPALFGIGMASGFRPPGEPSFSGQTNGVWLYHNVVGERILEGLETRSAWTR